LDDHWLVVGLGNPGPGYAGNRHNVGQMALALLADRASASFKNHKANAAVASGRSFAAGPQLLLAKPNTFMNVSGGPVAELLGFYSLEPERLIVVHDELDIPYGTVRLKQGGGDNGHNGLRSITKSVGGRDYLRTRFGVGRPPGRMDPATFVLRDFSGTERKELDLHVEHAADAVEALIGQGLDAAQNAFHGS
jgi:PTH1 family peptidyl-tRNA hydrolase